MCFSIFASQYVSSRCVAAFCGWGRSAVCRVCVCVCVQSVQINALNVAGWLNNAFHSVSRFSEVQNRREPFDAALRSRPPLWGRWVTLCLQRCHSEEGLHTLQIKMISSLYSAAAVPGTIRGSLNHGWDFFWTLSHVGVFGCRKVFTKYQFSEEFNKEIFWVETVVESFLWLR